jgi:tetratricopeptide (TPR) repeat protein
MPTKLSRFSEGVMEAIWLAAVIVVPVFFNVYSSRIFEPDKLTILRTLALITLVAWLVKLLEEGRVRWERIQPGESWLRTIASTPLMIPVVSLAVLYVISSIFSVSPATSLWGSYQRLQGTYTTFSYLVIFFAVVGNLRRRAQVERLITAVVVSSLPVSLYGVLQHYQIDPVPWGGNVALRIAANMGNSIFVAAYLIMVIPLTLVRILNSFSAILSTEQDGRGTLLSNFARATCYVFIVALQLIALYFSGSRGPWLGWGASLIFMGLGLSLIWRKRWLTIAGVAVVMLAVVFLTVLNIPNGPLEGLRSLQGIGRLGQLLDAESRTGRVRTLIWQGASELVAPHSPIEFPDGSLDRFNFLRPLIGYGPESMYVAYNRFYQPELTQVESRNASPDRSHNETWDSLVITGGLGLIVYLTLFGSVIYFGLKWLGFVTSDRQRNLFLTLYLLGGVISSVGFVAWKGIAYFGVGLPFGMILGVILYLVLFTLFGKYQVLDTPEEKLRALTLLGLLAVIVAHFVEINFGIAIAVTRTYFWTFSGMMMLVGYILPRHGEYGKLAFAATSEAKEAHTSSEEQPVSRRQKRSGSGNQAKKKRRSARASSRSFGQNWPDWLHEGLIAAFIVGVILITLGYDFISNSRGGNTTIQVLVDSMVRLRNTSTSISYGVLAMILTSWLIASVVFASESEHVQDDAAWVKNLVVILGSSLLLGMVYWLWHADGLASLARSTASTLDDVLVQIGRYESLLTKYYIFLILLIFLGGTFLPEEWPVQATRNSLVAAGVAPAALIIALYLSSYTNLRVIQADIAFKLADPFTRNNQWPVAIAIYDRANALAPSEDYYYLFLGRAYLEQAKTLTDTTERDNLIAKAEKDLKKAQAISPLNTDHTANLARLYSLWASYATDPSVRQERAQTSSQYFSEALTLSPKNARLWDEWALLALNVTDQPELADQRLQQALEIDPYYDWTYGLMGDYFSRTSQVISDTQKKQDNLEKAAENYDQAIQLAKGDTASLRYNYALALGGVQTQLEQPQDAITAYQAAINWAPSNSDTWRIEETIARLYAQTGDMTNALVHAQNALKTAPDDQKDRLQSLVAQLTGQP